ncbi:MAG TPA: DNA translocase FtsK 4TM domain-containing protein, partial [Psychromonas sp.]
MSKNNFLNRLSGVQKLLEVGIIACAFVAIFISISLFTFSPVDPSWSQQQWVAEIQNAGGKVGAWIADILFYGFGLLAYFIPVVIATFAWIFLWKPKFSLDIDFLNLGLRIIGFIFTVFSTTALASLNFDDYHYYPSGGLIGDIIAQSMLGFFSLLAVNLILLTLLISGTTLLLGFSWLSLIDTLGALVISLCSWLFALPERFSNWKENGSTEQLLQTETALDMPIDMGKQQSEQPEPIIKAVSNNIAEQNEAVHFADADID